MVGYLPDTFGHNSQLPTLLRGCNWTTSCSGAALIMTRRLHRASLSGVRRQVRKSLPAQCCLATGQPKYSTGRCPPAGKIFPMVNLIRQRAGLHDLLLPCGGDQVNIDPLLPEILQTVSERSPTGDRFQISSLEAFVDTLRQQADGFTCWQGELKSPRYTRIHKTIGSVRYDIKRKITISNNFCWASWNRLLRWPAIMIFTSTSSGLIKSGKTCYATMPMTP